MMKTAILSKVNFNNLENFASGTNSIYKTESRYNSPGSTNLVSSCASINAIAYYYHILAGEERINLAGVGLYPNRKAAYSLVISSPKITN